MLRVMGSQQIFLAEIEHFSQRIQSCCWWCPCQLVKRPSSEKIPASGKKSGGNSASIWTTGASPCRTAECGRIKLSDTFARRESPGLQIPGYAGENLLPPNL